MSSENVSIEQVPKGRLGLWLLIAGELIIFGGFIAMYALARVEYGEQFHHAMEIINPVLGAINTMVLLTSSFFIVKAHEAANNNELGKMKMFMIGTLALAATFMVIKLGFEWPHDFHEGASLISSKNWGYGEPWTGAWAHGAGVDTPVGSPERIGTLFWSYYFLMTGFHGLHVVLGALAIFIVMLGASKGKNLHRVELVGLYWHMVDLIWIFLFPMFYLAQ